MKKYLMKDNRDGSEAVYETSVGISETDTEITFAFDAKHSDFIVRITNITKFIRAETR